MLTNLIRFMRLSVRDGCASWRANSASPDPLGCFADYSYNGYSHDGQVARAGSLSCRRLAARPRRPRQAPRRLPAVSVAVGEHTRHRPPGGVLQLPDAVGSHRAVEARGAAVGRVARSAGAAERDADEQDVGAAVHGARALAALKSLPCSC